MQTALLRVSADKSAALVSYQERRVIIDSLYTRSIVVKAPFTQNGQYRGWHSKDIDCNSQGELEAISIEFFLALCKLYLTHPLQHL